MAQETAASMRAPQGGLLRAWTDALFHPTFETYARWYLKMGPRWRRTSLAVSLPLLLAAIVALIAHDALRVGAGIHALTGSRFLSYLDSPHGLFQLFAFSVGAIAAIVAIPAAVALFAHRSRGRYRIRFSITYCTWMQTLPMTCVFLLFGAVGYLVLGFFDWSSFLYQASLFIFAYLPVNTAWGLGCAGLSAATRRRIYEIGLVMLAIYVVIVLLVWHLLGHILVVLGYPVL
jgi:hypothetical protein